MKTSKILIAFISIFLVLTVGCANGIKNEGNKIIVEKQAGEADNYEYYNKINDNKEVQKAKDILGSIRWENAIVDMVHSPDYKFHFENNKEQLSGSVYELWISPDKGRIELVIDNENKYVHLNKEVSVELFGIITGNKLVED